jgi:RimJ/RimL family protein N-acetyltransferase
MPDWVFQTARLRIRPLLPADADAWHAVRAAAPFDPIGRSVADSRAIAVAMQNRAAIDSDGWQQFAITDAAGHFLGDIGVRFSAPRLAQAEIGFAVAPEVQGRGIASEAVAAMVVQLFSHGRRRVSAVTDARNRPAQRVLERSWFRLEGRFVESWPDGDGWFDELAYARLAGD